MRSILEVPCKCDGCGWSGTVYDCEPDVDGDGGLGCPQCSAVITVVVSAYTEAWAAITQYVTGTGREAHQRYALYRRLRAEKANHERALQQALNCERETLPPVTFETDDESLSS